MCDEAEPGLCAAGSFIFGTFVGTLGGWVSTLFFDGSWAPVPGLACGSTFGILAAAFPNGPPARVAAAVLVAASPVAGATCSALLYPGAPFDPTFCLAAAAFSSGAGTLALLASGALALHRRRRQQEIDLAKSLTV